MGTHPRMIAEKFQPARSLQSAEMLSRPSTTFWRDAWSRFKKNKLAVTGLAVIIILTLMAFVVSPAVASIQGHSYDYQDWDNINARPNAEYWFGTDTLGRCIFTRLWYGMRISLLIGISAALIDLIIGGLYGGISGLKGGAVDDVMMRIVDILYGVPYLLVVLLLRIWLEGGVWQLILALSITGWVGMARLVRGQVLQAKEYDYVLAARALGAGTVRIIRRHLFPNVLGVILVQLTLTVPAAIFAEAFLSFIGLGLPMPQASLGTMVNDSYTLIRLHPYQLFIPALAICIIMLGFNFLGDGLRDAFDPRQRH
ncbi:MAG TPA: ABC transporter permease [Firmicutes bacterium]|nr:ABC transporter permease [Bacillota bacterium]